LRRRSDALDEAQRRHGGEAALRRTRAAFDPSRRQDPHVVERARHRRPVAPLARSTFLRGSISRRAPDALRRTAWHGGRPLATRRMTTRINAYLDDYAFPLAALVELMQARFRLEDTRGLGAADVLLDQFEDRTDGGFF
jgi:hypothetical protein